MNKFSKTILIISIAVIGASALGVSFAQAENIDVEVWDGQSFIQCPNRVCPPLFNESNFLPGEGITKWLKVTNSSGVAKSIATEAINYPGFPNPANIPAYDLSRALEIVIREKAGADLYGGFTGVKTLFEFYNDGETYLSDIDDGNFKEYEFEINFPADKKDKWQNKTTSFDIIVGFQGEEGTGTGSTPPPSGGGGLPPGLTIQYEDSQVGETTATITWLTSYNSTSRVVYSATSGTFDLYAGPLNNYGYAYSKEGDDTRIDKVTGHSVTITGLTDSTKYFFRCVSHASPPTIGTEHSFTTLAMGETTAEGDAGDEGTGEEDDEGAGEEGGAGAGEDDQLSMINDKSWTGATGDTGAAAAPDADAGTGGADTGAGAEEPGVGAGDIGEEEEWQGHGETEQGQEDEEVAAEDDASKFLASIGAFFSNLHGWRLALTFLLGIIFALLILRLIKSWFDRKKNH